MKGLINRFLSLFLCLVVLCTAVPLVDASAASSKVEAGNLFDVSGKYIYYSKNMQGTRTGLMRYDTQTGEKKELYSYKYKGENTNGFSNIISKGDYIYAIWDFYTGSYTSDPYIYRFNKDGSGKKKLAFADEFYIKGSKIYYKKVKWMERGTVSEYTTSAGYYAMNLDGTGKKKISSSKWKAIQTKSERYCLYSISTEYSTVSKANWEYHADDREIWRVSKHTGETQQIQWIPLVDMRHTYVEIHGDWIIYQIEEYAPDIFNPYASLYIVSTSGNNEKELKSWQLGE